MLKKNYEYSSLEIPGYILGQMSNPGLAWKKGRFQNKWWRWWWWWWWFWSRLKLVGIISSPDIIANTPRRTAFFICVTEGYFQRDSWEIYSGEKSFVLGQSSCDKFVDSENWKLWKSLIFIYCISRIWYFRICMVFSGLNYNYYMSPYAGKNWLGTNLMLSKKITLLWRLVAFSSNYQSIATFF